MAQPGTPVSVLLVDDDPDIRTIYGSKLIADGVDVSFAANGPQALSAAMRPPGLILLDMRMPGMDGLEVLRRLKGDAYAAKVPVVMLSNECDGTAASACRELGAIAWWSKVGLQPAELSRRVIELLGIGRQRT